MLRELNFVGKLVYGTTWILCSSIWFASLFTNTASKPFTLLGIFMLIAALISLVFFLMIFLNKTARDIFVREEVLPNTIFVKMLLPTSAHLAIALLITFIFLQTDL